MTRYAPAERDALCDTFERFGPDAPTLCSPWLTRDLAAHLVVRERRPDTAAGIALPALASRTERVRDDYAARPWPKLVDLVRSGPPVWSPTRLPALDESSNLAELFLHHEDVLRGGTSWDARALDAGLESALWAVLSRFGRLLLRRSPVGVVLVTPADGRHRIKDQTKLGTVVLRGTPGELMLYASGRERVADVLLDGPDEAVAAFSGTRLGLF